MEETSFQQLEKAFEKEVQRVKQFGFVQTFERMNRVQTVIKLRRLFCVRFSEERHDDSGYLSEEFEDMEEEDEINFHALRFHDDLLLHLRGWIEEYVEADDTIQRTLQERDWELVYDFKVYFTQV